MVHCVYIDNRYVIHYNFNTKKNLLAYLAELIV